MTHPNQQRKDVVKRRSQYKTMMSVLVSHLMRLVYLDEAGVHKNMVRTHGRAPKGKRVVCHQETRGKNYTLLGAISCQKVLLHRLFCGGAKAKDVLEFVKELSEHLRGGQAVVMDNAKIHTCIWEELTEVLGKVGCVVLFQPPYSPECNAIEQLWSQLKRHIRSWEPRSVKCLREALEEALARVTSDHLLSYFLDARKCVLQW